MNNWYKKSQNNWKELNRQKAESLKVPIDSLHKAGEVIGWISPMGDFYKVGDSEHIDFIMKMMGIKDEYNIAAIRFKAHSMGWVRARYFFAFREKPESIEFTGTRDGISHNMEIIKRIAENTGSKIDYYFV